ncbi:MAG: glycosyltransferase family 39 protein [Thermoleophilia bacterium]|nr:glycosyltransferase family 39 protein [Thermoleophilia bacterium]
MATFLLARLSAWPPHEDEALALFVGRHSLPEVLATVHGERGGAPLHFVFAWAVASLGGGLTELRVLSALFASASVPLVALLGRRLASRAAALAATLLVSASWMLLFHGVYGRMYSLFLFASALSYLAFLAASERGGRRRWALWAAAALATVAAHPYGALVLASQGAYALVSRARLRQAAAAFGAVAIAGIPFWYTDLVLAHRFDVGVGGGGAKLSGPLDVVGYLVRTAGDFTARWWLILGPVLVLAAVGLARLPRAAAALVGGAAIVPALAFLAARLGGSASPESRHLIFALPLFAVAVAAGLLALGRVAPLVLAALVAAQLAWAHDRTPELFEGEPPARRAARAGASAWLAETGRPGDVLFGYDPLFLAAWERDSRYSSTVVPRADSALALDALLEAPQPLGRGVWVLDASDTNNTHPALRIARRLPHPPSEFEARVFGPFLVVRTREPSRTPARFLEQSTRVMATGKSLDIGDADVNFVTARRAADRLARRGAPAS